MDHPKEQPESRPRRPERRPHPAEPRPGVRHLLALRLRRAQDETEELRAALATRPLTALATGVLAERLGCGPAEAGAQLLALAERAHLGPQELAADILTTLPAAADGATTTGPGPAPPAPPAGPSGRPPPVVEAALAQVAGMLGASAAVLWTVQPGGVLHAAAAPGFSEGERAAWQHVPPGVPTPAQQALDRRAELGPTGPVTATLGAGRAPYRLAVPLHRAAGPAAVLELAWPRRPAEPTAAERRRLRVAAEVSALALTDRPDPIGAAVADEPDTAALDAALTPALLLAPEPATGPPADFRIVRVNAAFTDPADRPPHRVEGRTLTAVYPRACADGLLDLLLRVHATGRPYHADSLALTFLSGQTPVPVLLELAAARLAAPPGRLLVGWRPAGADDRDDRLLRTAQRLTHLAGFEEDLRTGEIHWTPRTAELLGLPAGTAPIPLAALPAHVHPDDEQNVRRVVNSALENGRSGAAVFRMRHLSSYTHYVRLVAEPVPDPGGRTAAVHGAFQDVSAQHWTETALAATTESLADSRQQSAERHLLARRLQQAILPPAPPPLESAGLRAAVRYRPSSQEDRVGGDWYDTTLLPDRTALLVVGDMAGHGVEAAQGMVALRHALRGLAYTGAGPGRLLGWLNRATTDLTGAATATAVCARYHPDTRTLHWARAGHLPPVLLRDGTARPLPMPHGILLGAADDPDYQEHHLAMRPGDVLLLYTDGLIERRDQSVEEPLAHLTRILAEPAADLDALLDRALATSTADTDDDTCLIAVEVLPAADTDPGESV
ncbi:MULTISPECIES: SpoIIE family protein phosphatase [Kitasatospora]|uniref:Putative serine/threonine protein phosphatase n=1 Tax=Kitasatospora setae (strain ATCC 33774 / DSM 43861 / JCM 3304 / KCC A-0304 / NBRC 14216 / KM-6054) TaxID=452652 RepID=E4N5R2_KITSK|nr:MULTISPECIES: SpoIIE family protein phosphatase [Kitasatospora]BAJ26543.1 putative serine/threonine protein phosphatase [Kitasatospora setae KM-6054]